MGIRGNDMQAERVEGAVIGLWHYQQGSPQSCSSVHSQARPTGAADAD